VVSQVYYAPNSEQSYALFLPPGYSPEKKWPILYAFDPVARGAVPVKLFKDAAEKFSFIVVGSNNSRNGIDVNDIVKTLWADTHERFSIDERRVYTTGFSGGARVASALAVSYRGAVAGVIAASGGLPPSFKLSAANQFVFFGTAGTDDFNFPEMQRLKRTLDALSITNRLAIFDGGHDWPPADLCTEAIAWMEVQAMKLGSRAKADVLIDARLNLKIKTARDYEASNKTYEAYLEYADLVTEFRGLREVNEFAAAVERLTSSKGVRAAIKSERAEEDNQASQQAKLESIIARLPEASSYSETMAELKSNLSELTKRAEASKSISEQHIARRVLQSLRVRIYEEAFALRQRKDFASIPAKLELATLINPKDPRPFYDLATAYARAGNKSRAKTALSQAIERGFSDLARIEQNEDFAILRNDSDYKKLVDGLRKEP
jgi:dienelactone hydrolase